MIRPSNRPDKIPISFYPEFWDNDRLELPDAACEALVSFLERLQSDPMDSEIRQKAQTNGKGHFAYVFYEGYAVYWSVVTPKGKLLSLLSSSKPIRIDVLDVTQKSLKMPTEEK